MEGEPLSAKDAVLLSRSAGPGRGRARRCSGRALGARPGGARPRARDHLPIPSAGGPAQPGRGPVPHRWLRGRPGVGAGQPARRPGRRPSDPLVPVWQARRRGPPHARPQRRDPGAGRPAGAPRGRTGSARVGTPTTPAPSWSRSAPAARDPDAPRRASRCRAARRCATCCSPAGADRDRVRAVLVGGYHGAWVPGRRSTCRSPSATSRRSAPRPGAGVLHVLDRDTCPLGTPPTVARYLAGQSRPPVRPVRQRTAPDGRHACTGWPARAPTRGLSAEVERLRALVDGRGACAHPDGTARFVASTMRVFADHVDRTSRRVPRLGVERAWRCAGCTLTGPAATGTAPAPSCCRSC